MNRFFDSIEQDLLESLTRRVSILSLDLVAAGWWPGDQQRVLRRRLLRIESTGLAELHIINAHPLLPVDRPLLAWRPGDDDPDSEQVSLATRERWSRPAVPTAVCVASALLANMLGSTAGGLPPLEHRDHDLRLASVYIHYRQHSPHLAGLWIGEHARPKAGYRIKDPDAFLIDAAGRVLCIVESAGRYGPQQVESFHEHCVENELAYELW